MPHTGYFLHCELQIRFDYFRLALGVTDEHTLELSTEGLNHWLARNDKADKHQKGHLL
jgi:hypothetical protein